MLTVERIKQVVTPLAEKYDIRKVELFGSYAKGNATEKSDLDLLVLFNVEIPTIYNVMGFKAELEQALNYSVDVVTLPLTRPDKIRIDKVVEVYERT